MSCTDLNFQSNYASRVNVWNLARLNKVAVYYSFEPVVEVGVTLRVPLCVSVCVFSLGPQHLEWIR